jgi:hypothetical protein
MKPLTLTDCNYTTVPGKWPFVLTSDLVTDLCLGLCGEHTLVHRGRMMGTLVDDRLTIFAGYASDGASPHFFTIGKLRFGTPSHRKTAPGFFVHDFLYQFGRLPCCPWTFSQADDVLYHLMRQEGSILAAPYHAAVSIFGGLHRKITGSSSAAISCNTKHKTAP